MKLKQMKPRHFAVAVALGLAAAWFANDQEASFLAEAAPAGQGTAKAGTMVTTEVIDHQQIFGQPMSILHVDLPARWTLESQVLVDQNSCNPQVGLLLWKAVSPDGKAMIEKNSPMAWTQAGMGACPQAPWRNPQEYLTAMAQQVRPNAQVLGYDDLRQISDRKNRELAEVVAMARQNGIQMQMHMETGRLRLAYQANGIDMLENLEVSILVTQSQMPPVVNLVADGILVYSASREQFDASLPERIIASARVNPQWIAQTQQYNTMLRQNQHQAAMDSIAAQGRASTARHQANMAAIRAAGQASTQAHNERMATMDANHQSYMGRMATMDNMQRQRLEAIGEYNTYQGVDGNPVQSSIHNGERVFQNQVDPRQIYTTDDPYANPVDGYSELQRK